MWHSPSPKDRVVVGSVSGRCRVGVESTTRFLPHEGAYALNCRFERETAESCRFRKIIYKVSDGPTL
ncbi:hypothetical protein HSB1_03860 [Halogranum salarium B-1]|uniref:Uncharacterized protein n=1 Tax=Halogranum salarium B-1 TaxID=1210908 RepID=J2ZKU6_9EURY|nr:hypothetical protein HSB1_03860 [Halogranum salarium B-1]